MAQWSVLGTTFQIVMVVIPPLLYVYIFQPCWDCYDFEAAMVHEIGHLLGLGHPNMVKEELATSVFETYDLFNYETNGQYVYSDTMYHSLLAAGIPLNETTCQNPWNYVHAGIPPGAEAAKTGCEYGTSTIASCEAMGGVRDSVMLAFTQHNPSTCLYQDDLEAIQTMYPDCHYSKTEVVCYEIQLNLGFVRIAYFVFIPLIVVLFSLIICQALIQHHNRAELAEAKDAKAEAQKNTVALKLKLSAAKAAKREAKRRQEAELRAHRCDPDSPNRSHRSFGFLKKAPSVGGASSSPTGDSPSQGSRRFFPRSFKKPASQLPSEPAYPADETVM